MSGAVAVWYPMSFPSSTTTAWKSCRPLGIATISPIDLFAPHIGASQEGSASGDTAGAAGDASLGVGTMHPHERWAAVALQLDGEETVGRCNCMQYLLLAELLLLGPLLQQPLDGPAATGKASACDMLGHAQRGKQAHAAGETSSAGRSLPLLCPGFSATLSQQLPSWLWWALRATSLHQQLLAGRSPTLLGRAGMLMGLLGGWVGAEGSPLDPAVATAGAVEREADVSRPLHGRPELQGALCIEMALIKYGYGHADQGQRLLDAAGQLLGLEVELSGE